MTLVTAWQGRYRHGTMRWFALLVALGTAAAWSCTVDPVDIEGKPCPCPGDFRCDPSTDRCTRTPAATGGAAGDGGSSDSATGGDSSTACPALPDQVRPTISSGHSHVCAVKNGQLFCWGDNAAGQLGTGNKTPFATPQLIGSFNDWRAVSSFNAHTCARRESSSLYCWGNNGEGQLGLGDTAEHLAPEKIGPNRTFSALAVGGQMSCALDLANALFCWGDTVGGAVGSGVFGGPVESTPFKVSEAAHRAVSAGSGHGCGLRDDGHLYCWGYNACNQTTLPSQAGVPTKVSDACYRRVTAGHQHTCVIDFDGRLFCAGSNELGQLGIGQSGTGIPGRLGCSDTFAAFQAVLPGERFRAVEASHVSTCAISVSGALYCWGINQERGVSPNNAHPVLTPMQLGSDTDWDEVAPGFHHTCAKKGNGDVYCWGGNGDIGPSKMPPTLVTL